MKGMYLVFDYEHWQIAVAPTDGIPQELEDVGPQSIDYATPAQNYNNLSVGHNIITYSHPYRTFVTTTYPSPTKNVNDDGGQFL